ncbi:MAG: TlpA family protein disulfide reductase, partial [Chloroflexi bacterium]|nr:TlpA family protein disulfide reductase [Chloroflexota bacterium]
EDVVLANVAPSSRAEQRQNWLAEKKQEHKVTVLAPPAPIIGLLVGNIAPDFTLRTLSGDTLRLADLRGQVVLLNFWATWCGPCQKEMPLLMESYLQYQDQGFVVVGINVGESTLKIQSFVDALQITFPIALDEKLQVNHQYRVFGLPTSFLLDRQGVIDYRAIGALRQSEWERVLKQTMAK